MFARDKANASSAGLSLFLGPQFHATVYRRPSDFVALLVSAGDRPLQHLAIEKVTRQATFFVLCHNTRRTTWLIHA
jgi:hypothetical protein